MKRIFTILVAVLLTATLWAQSPEKMSYQAVIRNSSNVLVTSQAVGMQISILQGSADGTAVYTETQAPTTNFNGLVSLEIGNGTVVRGDFAAIDWANGTYFIKTETDPTGGTTYSITGTSQLLSVPYALHAKTAETVTGSITETDPSFTAWDKTTGISITESQISNFGTYLITENQNLNDVIAVNNSANSQIKNVTNPTEAQDAATKAYVDLLKVQIEELQILAGVKVKDIDGNFYNKVTIGSQIWLQENLATTKYNDGTDIPNVTDNTAWTQLSTPAYCWYNNDYATYGSVYGALYNWYAVDPASNGGKNVCPIGWHVPTDDEWTTLTTYLGGESVAGGKMKEAGTTHWDSPNTGATNESGFTGLPSGYRLNNSGLFSNSGNAGNAGNYWSSTAASASFARYRFLDYEYALVYSYLFGKQLGFAVRCIKD